MRSLARSGPRHATRIGVVAAVAASLVGATPLGAEAEPSSPSASTAPDDVGTVPGGAGSAPGDAGSVLDDAGTTVLVDDSGAPGQQPEPTAGAASERSWQAPAEATPPAAPDPERSAQPEPRDTAREQHDRARTEVTSVMRMATPPPTSDPTPSSASTPPSAPATVDEASRPEDPGWEPDLTAPRPLADVGPGVVGLPQDPPPRTDGAGVMSSPEAESAPREDPSPTAASAPAAAAGVLPDPRPTPAAALSEPSASSASSPSSAPPTAAPTSAASAPPPAPGSSAPSPTYAATPPTPAPTSSPTPTHTPAPPRAPRVARPSPAPSPSRARASGHARRAPTPAPSSTGRARHAAPTPEPRRRAESRPATDRNRGARIIDIARSLGGIPYLWGGTTTSGFDCSGFTRHVMRRAGVSLPRTAAEQQRATRRVHDPRPGDLVFFGTPAHHVGIYAGDGRMYDAPRRGKTTGLHRIWSSDVTYGRPR